LSFIAFKRILEYCFSSRYCCYCCCCNCS